MLGENKGKVLENGNGFIVSLGDEYFLLEQAWIINSEGKILLTQRSLNKSHGGMWESTAGHVLSGESDLEGIQREVKEELGLDINKDKFNFIRYDVIKQTILDIWVVRVDVKIEDLKLQEEEVMDAKFVTINEFKEMLNKKEVIENLSYFIDIYNSL